MFETVLIANRGEIAVRIIETCRRLQIKAVAVYSEADAHSRHVRMADDAVLIGPAEPAASYVDVDRVLEAARVAGAQAIHPGYGFLAENAAAASRILDAGLAWIGPSAQAIATMGDKVAARNAVAAAGIAVAPGADHAVDDVDSALEQAAALDYPVILKAVSSGGGLGVAVARDDRTLRAVFGPLQERVARFFGSAGILVERYLSPVRHVEVQLLGLADSRIVALGERDCSVQRRHQKIAGEAPAPGLSDSTRARLSRTARQIAELVDYRGAGTVEFLLDTRTEEFVFCEMNCRLQVEHPLTELVTGIDVVEQQLLIAAGAPPSFDADEPPRPDGHAIEVRIYAEDPERFAAATGRITGWQEPSGEGIRFDHGYGRRDRVPPHYDPLLGKVAVWGPDRDAALDRLRSALGQLRIEGPACNLPFFTELLDDPSYRAGTYDTGLVARLRPAA
jgi:acetyl-CoA carboxylase biotin carboxylase subunit